MELNNSTLLHQKGLECECTCFGVWALTWPCFVGADTSYFLDSHAVLYCAQTQNPSQVEEVSDLQESFKCSCSTIWLNLSAENLTEPLAGRLVQWGFTTRKVSDFQAIVAQSRHEVHKAPASTRLAGFIR